MPIFHPVDGIPKAIIHLAKYHSWVHGFVDSGQMKVVNVLCNSSKKWRCMVTQFNVYTQVHFTLISTIVSCKWANAQSMGVDEASDTSTLSKQLSSSMVVSPPMSRRSTFSTRSWLKSSSSNAPSSNCKYVESVNMHFKPPWCVP